MTSGRVPGLEHRDCRAALSPADPAAPACTRQAKRLRQTAMWPVTHFVPSAAAAADTAWLTLRWAPSAGPLESAQLLQARAELAERVTAQALLQAAADSAILKHQEAQVGQSGWRLPACSP